MINCLACGHWTDKARGTANGEHWCRQIHTWTPPGFHCSEFDDEPMDDAPGSWYTVAEVADMCHVAHSTVTYWISTGRLKAYPMANPDVKLSGQFQIKWRIDKAMADRYAEWYNSIVGR